MRISFLEDSWLLGLFYIFLCLYLRSWTFPSCSFIILKYKTATKCMPKIEHVWYYIYYVVRMPLEGNEYCEGKPLCATRRLQWTTITRGKMNSAVIVGHFKWWIPRWEFRDLKIPKAKHFVIAWCGVGESLCKHDWRRLPLVYVIDGSYIIQNHSIWLGCSYSSLQD